MFNVHLMFTTSKSKKRFDCLSTNNLTTKPVEQFPIGNIHISKISFVISCSPETIGNPKRQSRQRIRIVRIRVRIRIQSTHVCPMAKMNLSKIETTKTHQFQAHFLNGSNKLEQTISFHIKHYLFLVSHIFGVVGAFGKI